MIINGGLDGRLFQTPTKRGGFTSYIKWGALEIGIVGGAPVCETR